MKSKYIYLILLFSVLQMGLTQENNTVESEFLYERNQVDLFTGTPNIRIPLYAMPTRAKGISLKTFFTYHPSTISEYNKNTHNAGKGWSFRFPSGVISRTGAYLQGYGLIDELRWTENIFSPPNIYEFNILHLKGKFTIEKSGTSFVVTVTESGDEAPKVDVDYNAVSNTIESFKLYDSNGYIYHFDITDTAEVITPDNSIMEYNKSFHLSSVVDSNLREIVTFEYTDNFYTDSNGRNYKFNYLNKIISNGFGKIALDLTIVSNFRAVYNYMDIYDHLNNHILNVAYDDIQNRLVKSVPGQVNDQIYHFKYKAPLYSGSERDEWGYPIVEDCNLYYFGNQDVATGGVLQQVIYPTGGSVIYEFESNTYSHKESTTALDANEPDFFINSDYSENWHNFHTVTKGDFTFGPGSNQDPFLFVVESTQDYYFKPNATMFYVPEIGDYGYPVFILKKNGIVVANINVNSADENNCLGKKLTLAPGGYSIGMSHTNLTSGQIQIRTLEPNESSSIKKYWYGGGIRIKRIGYFDKEVPNNYYELLTPPSINPIKEIQYSYNFFNDLNSSSGHLRYFNPLIDIFRGYALVHYKNVTVKENSGNGKTEFEFFSPIDEEVWASSKFGALLKKKIYDNQNNLIEEIEMEYEDFVSLDESLTLFDDYELKSGWAVPTTIMEKTYSDTNVLGKTQDNNYNPGVRRIVESTNTTSIAGVTQTKKYFYHTLNSIHSKNRCQLERVETYVNSNLTHVSRVIYSNTWPALPEDGGGTNVSYLPLRTESSKNGTDFKVVSKVNLYDKYSNIVEYENEQGTKIVNIWGYNKTQIVAKLEGISYGQIPQNLITAIQTASDGNNEAELLSALQALRDDTSPAIQNALITTYTYKPLIGISTQTDYRGRRTSYYYDDFGRLKEVRDHNNNLLTEKEYYYESQN